jgi:hypothetical protein
LKLYYICDCCREIYHNEDVEGPEGAAEVRGLCPDCQSELGQEATPALSSMRPFYH